MKLTQRQTSFQVASLWRLTSIKLAQIVLHNWGKRGLDIVTLPGGLYPDPDTLSRPRVESLPGYIFLSRESGAFVSRDSGGGQIAKKS